MTNDDKATEREEQHREWALKYRKLGGPKPNGSCHYCGEPVARGAQFCNQDCRSDHQMAERAKVQNKGRESWT